jgi:ribonucleoside-diphosphate reductase alpha chain
MVHGASSGIEPIFAAMYFRRYREANAWRETVVLDPMFKEYLEHGKDLTSFVGAYDITPEEHIKVQATIQKYIDNAISKTINLPITSKAEDLVDLALSYAPYLKGLTIYKEGSKGEEPLKAIPLTPENIEKYSKVETLKASESDAIMCKVGGECGA